jgi:hypothetical protein
MRFNSVERNVKYEIYEASLNVNREWRTDCSAITNQYIFLKIEWGENGSASS